jgi:hypothetical protein
VCFVVRLAVSVHRRSGSRYPQPPGSALAAVRPRARLPGPRYLGLGSTAAQGSLSCQGPVYLREMRRRVSHHGVRILDHPPATLSGMEFSNYYGIVQAGGTMDKNGFYASATFTDEDGNVPSFGRPTDSGIRGGNTWLMEAALHGPVHAIFDRAREELQPTMRARVPNFFVGLRPGRDRLSPATVRIEYILEGTTRGTGGVRIVDDTCWTGVPGLWVAGDAASREPLVGGATGGGAPNSAFTIGSGIWAYRAALQRAESRGMHQRTDFSSPTRRCGAGSCSTASVRPSCHSLTSPIRIGPTNRRGARGCLRSCEVFVTVRSRPWGQGADRDMW